MFVDVTAPAAPVARLTVMACPATSIVSGASFAPGSTSATVMLFPSAPATRAITSMAALPAPTSTSAAVTGLLVSVRPAIPLSVRPAAVPSCRASPTNTAAWEATSLRAATFTTTTRAPIWSKMPSSAVGMVPPATPKRSIAARRLPAIRTGSLTGPVRAVPTSPITPVETVRTGGAPLSTSTTSTPCKNAIGAPLSSRNNQNPARVAIGAVASAVLAATAWAA